MLIEEKFVVLAPIQRVWDFMMEPEKITSCIPGCEKIIVRDEKNYFAAVKAEVGPISVRFEFNTEIVEIAPPFHVRTVSRGEDKGKKGNFRQETTLNLRKISENETEVSYKSEVNVGGKLATFGAAIIRVKAKKLGEQFANSIKDKLDKR